ncbi:MAG: hypothetical protein D6820_14170, partial [Lentisphaerae bacterium]
MPNVVILCQNEDGGCGTKDARAVAPEKLKRWLGTDWEIWMVADLCGFVLREQARLADVQVRAVAGCRERLLRNLYDWEDGVRFFAAHDTPEMEELALWCREAGSGKGEARLREFGWEEDWRPWYPVLDRERCNDCGLCLSYCLFDVYERDCAGRVVVTRPENCKDGCPACARICRVGAVMFGKCGEAPYDGSAIEDELLLAEKQSLYAEMMGSSDHV